MSKDTKLTDAEIVEKREALQKAQAEATLLKSELGEDGGETVVTESDLEKSLKTLEATAQDSIEKCDTGKKVKKDDKSDDDEDGDGTEKSFADHVADDADASEGVEVSPFLGGITKSIGAHMDAMADSQADIMKSLKSQAEFGQALTQVIKAQATEIADLKKSIDAVEKLPGIRKSDLDGKGVDRGLGGSIDEPATSLTKAQVTTAIEDLCMKGELPVTAMAMFESSGEVDKAAIPKIEAYYKK